MGSAQHHFTNDNFHQRAAHRQSARTALADRRLPPRSRVALTSLGKGAFGNDETWIEAGMTRALQLARAFDLDVRLVSYGPPSPMFIRIAQAYS